LTPPCFPVFPHFIGQQFGSFGVDPMTKSRCTFADQQHMRQ
jgi:hypothetical protein